jgi:hypothetical protein
VTTTLIGLETLAGGYMDLVQGRASLYEGLRYKRPPQF